MSKLKTFTLDEIFTVKSGTYHAIKDLEPGNCPLVSCGELNNGVVGYFDIPDNSLFENVLTVAYNGQPLTTKYHPYKFGAKDDVAVLLPRYQISQITMLYIASLLNRMQWRFNYGRKCYREKMKKTSLILPCLYSESKKAVDQEYIRENYSGDYRNSIPKAGKVAMIDLPEPQWETFNIVDLLEIQRGDFHSLSALDEGNVPTVSRVSINQGVVGYFDVPENSEVYHRGMITVSTLGGDSFVQINDFIATDNVLICKNVNGFSLPVLFFIAFMINQSKWRYSYGRQCYLAKFSKLDIKLPVTEPGVIDQRFIELVIKNSKFWYLLSD